MNQSLATPNISRNNLALIPRDEHMARMEAMVDALNVQMTEPTHFVPTRERPCPVMRTRGVYMADFRMDGNPILQAVDEAGDLIAWQMWTADKTRESIEDELWAILNVRTSLR